MQLLRGAQRGPGDVGRVQPERKRVDTCRSAELGDAPDREERELGQAARGDDRVGDLELDGLEVAEPLTELMSVAYVLDRQVDGPFDVAEHRGGRQRPRERRRGIDVGSRRGGGPRS